MRVRTLRCVWVADSDKARIVVPFESTGLVGRLYCRPAVRVERRAGAVHLVVACAGLAFASGCAREASLPSAATVPEAAQSALGTAEPEADRARLDDVLADVGLAIDREVDLPGTDAVAHVVAVPGASALDAWAAARALVPETGRYPVIVGGPVAYGGDIETELEQTIESAEFQVDDGATAETELDAADNIDLGDWFSSRAANLQITPSELEARPPLPTYEWPKDQFSAHVDVVSGEPLATVEIALLPTRHSWEAPAYLLWGGWNDVPFPSEHVAVLRHWAETYRADVVAMTGAVVEMTVAAPPQDDDAAIALAREHFLYAPDNVWQGTGDLELLAAAVLDAPVWSFWWD